MGNCLVTKLKEAVNNDTLLKLDEMKVPVVNGYIRLNVLDENGAYVKGVGKVKVAGESYYEVGNGWSSNMKISGLDSLEVGYVIIGNKYKIASLSGCFLWSDDVIESIKYSPITQIISGDFDSYNNSDKMNFQVKSMVAAFPGLTVLGIGGKNASGDIADLYPLKEKLTQLHAFGSLVGSSANLTGDWTDLGYFTKLTTINIMSIWKGVSKGSIEDFVAKRLSVVPNTAGSFTGSWLGDGGRVTFEGSPIVNRQSTLVEWDANGTITVTQSGSY